MRCQPHLEPASEYRQPLQPARPIQVTGVDGTLTVPRIRTLRSPNFITYPRVGPTRNCHLGRHSAIVERVGPGAPRTRVLSTRETTVCQRGQGVGQTRNTKPGSPMSSGASLQLVMMILYRMPLFQRSNGRSIPK